MRTNQEHNSSGDNVAGNKYEQNSYYSKENLRSNVNSKLKQIKENQEYDIKDNAVVKALKEVVKELIESEQQKSHQIVPIGKVREKFKSLFSDETFHLLITELLEEKTIEIQDAQICFTTKKLNYKIKI